MFEQLKFRYPWRDYQQRVLAELETHLDDAHLHIVAAPGSGKTILGLEVMRQLNAPTLILAPSIAIRNQWVERLSMFLPEDAPKLDWVSKDLKQPKTVTVVTYQALHAAFSGAEQVIDDIGADENETEASPQKAEKGEVIDVIKLLQDLNVTTIILDEAHHLRKEWWRALTKLKKALVNTHMVALTATPPYDVDYTEWLKYQDLCGPIDAEISIPELVLANNLCPHQDYIHFSLPQGEEAKKLSDYKTNLSKFLKEIKIDENFLNIFAAHPWINDTEKHVEAILDEPEFFSAMVIYLHAVGVETPPYARQILGVGFSMIPKLSVSWLEVLFTGLLYTHHAHFTEHQEILDKVRKELKRIGAIERKKVIIDQTKEIQKILSQSLGKLDSILEITQTESATMGDDLRMVILADYIRQEEMPKGMGQEREVNRLGVVPIFEYLRRAAIKDVKLGVLTGSLIIIPAAAKDILCHVAEESNVELKNISFSPLLHDPNFLKVTITGQSRQNMVHLITEVFNKGGITGLIGTQALLGEGWDAPSVNTLILASYVGSYMLSNQMRGRAIRVDPNRPDKTSNIWHLVSLDLETVEEKLREWITGQTERQRHFDPFDDIQEDLGHDILRMRRRFKAFEGLSFGVYPLIENGFHRMYLSDVKWSRSGVKKINHRMLEGARNREELPSLWKRALKGKNIKPRMREKVKTNNAPKSIAYLDTLKYMVTNAVLSGVAWASQIFQAVEYTSNVRTISLIIIFACLAGFAVMVPKLLKALWLTIRNGSVEKSLEQVGHCVFDTLSHMRIIKTNADNIKMRTSYDKLGVAYLRLDGATNTEKRYFYEALRDILNPIDNPRYLIVRNSYLAGLLRVDYHAVPKMIGQHKQNAAFFATCWQKYIGRSELVYTRNKEGRKILLKARSKALSSAFRKKTEQVSVWE